ncbi:MAG: ion channel [Candidatus Dormibacteria bacterium]
MLIILVVLSDAVGTLMVTRGLAGRWRPTRIFYRGTWRLWRAVGVRIPSPTAREHFLSIYAPLSLLTLLLIWLAGLATGWALVYLGQRSQLHGADDFGSLVYYSGTALLTIGFGDITAQSTGLRLLTLLEALTGLGTIALLISFLPALYGAYGRREARLLTLDDPSGQRIQPTSLIVLGAPDGDVARLYSFFANWELWTAELLESHVSFPMLALFRSQHEGQSWITALGVVVDAATMMCALVPGADVREPYYLHRRGQRALTEIARRLHLRPATEAGPMVDRERFDVAYGRVVETGLPVRDADEAWELLKGYRSAYASTLQALIDFLVAPPGFWGHSAARVATTE